MPNRCAPLFAYVIVVIYIYIECEICIMCPIILVIQQQ